ncbi:hypothetical protein JOC95_001912 [Bacillus tianshenii]|uniref:Uncharacterized protein n=1 Tax=Sutcliffiella tianshenii TaxID=1463404 RepID=A0ABS2P0U4_9BACI|nr:hypothetical protein [Bacillus tianshenii]MBM7620060.1 hypothetical protein [Bacillus tianshenii]
MGKRNRKSGNKGSVLSREKQSASDKARNYYFKALKRCSPLYFETNSYFVFQFQGDFYITKGEIGSSTIFIYKEEHIANFTIATNVPETSEFYDALYKRYYHKLDDSMGNNPPDLGHDFLIQEFEHLELPIEMMPYQAEKEKKLFLIALKFELQWGNHLTESPLLY